MFFPPIFHVLPVVAVTKEMFRSSSFLRSPTFRMHEAPSVTRPVWQKCVNSCHFDASGPQRGKQGKHSRTCHDDCQESPAISMTEDEGRRRAVWAERPTPLMLPTPATVAQRLLTDRLQRQSLEARYFPSRDDSPRGSYDGLFGENWMRRSRDRSGRPSLDESPPGGQARAGASGSAAWRHSPLGRRSGYPSGFEEREKGRVSEPGDSGGEAWTLQLQLSPRTLAANNEVSTTRVAPSAGPRACSD